MPTVSALLVVEEKHYPDLKLQLQNLLTFDKVYVLLKDVPEDIELPFVMSDYLNATFISDRSGLSLDGAYHRLLDLCDTDYFTPHSPNHFTHGEIVKFVKPEMEKGFELIYSDEGYIENEGTPEMTVEYYHKPDFDKELLYCQNYINRGAFYKTETAKAIGAFTSELNENSDWNLALLFTHSVPVTSIRHIPIPLIAIKKDVLSNSKVQFMGDKWTFFSHLVKGYIHQTGRGAVLSLTRDRYILPVFEPLEKSKVAIIIPTRDKLDLLRPCLASILSLTTYTNYHIIVVDNNSEEEETQKFFEEINNDPKITVFRYPYEFDYAKMHNSVAAKLAEDDTYQFICLLNNDTQVINGQWLTDMVGIASDKTVGAVGAKLLYADNTIQHAGVVTGVRGLANHLYQGLSVKNDGYWSGLNLHRNCSAVTGACLLMRLSHYVRLNGMWTMLPIAYNDVDLCLRAMDINLRNVWSPNALLYHYESKSRGSELDKQNPEKLYRFARDHIYMRYQHGKRIHNDPFYNQNFSHESTHYKIGTCSPFRQKYGEKSYLLDFPMGLDFVDPQMLPMPTGSKFTFAVKVPRTAKGIIKGIGFPFHAQVIDKHDKATQFHLAVRFPGIEDVYHVEELIVNKDIAFIPFTGFEREIAGINSFIVELHIVATTAPIHLKWFYSEGEYSMAFESMKNTQFRLFMRLEDPQ